MVSQKQETRPGDIEESAQMEEMSCSNESYSLPTEVSAT